jgi:hypothetical protein
VVKDNQSIKEVDLVMSFKYGPKDDVYNKGDEKTVSMERGLKDGFLQWQ